MAIMDAQMDKVDAVEEFLGVRNSNAVSDNRTTRDKGKNVGQMGKEASGK